MEATLGCPEKAAFVPRSCRRHSAHVSNLLRAVLSSHSRAAQQGQSEGEGSLRAEAGKDDVGHAVGRWRRKSRLPRAGVETSGHAGVATTSRPFLNTPTAECYHFRLQAIRSVKTSVSSWEQACNSPQTPSGAGFFKRQLWTFRMYGTRLHDLIIRAQPRKLLLGQGVLRV